MKSTVLWLLAGVGAVLPGVAAAEGMYVRGGAGANFGSELSGEGALIAGTTRTSIFGATDISSGVAFHASLGQSIAPNIRVEAEFQFSDADLDKLDVDPSDGFTEIQSGSSTTWGGWVNVLYDLPTGGNLKPFVGAGVGYGELKVEFTDSDKDTFQGEDFAFGYQLIAGAALPLSDRLMLEGAYRYVRLNEAELSDFGYAQTFGANNAVLEGDRKDNLITVGLRYTFGK